MLQYCRFLESMSLTDFETVHGMDNIKFDIFMLNKIIYKLKAININNDYPYSLKTCNIAALLL